ncbi:hypothetical protein [Arthrobacter antibioticus]|uniref:hypothetical protein n=1 Tax=Arthrobacter sp. H35-MC1 TaxID=3046203 RepID=UPI0024BB7F21|nr:hypothetical protein [Arthrobacter sp. H35-MC1]MDJ0318352.1 hypothetical protein [Arthrobacter sp. H35-MC1]
MGNNPTIMKELILMTSPDDEFDDDKHHADEVVGPNVDDGIGLDDSKSRNVVHIDDIKAEAERKDQQRIADGKMSLLRYQEILDAKKAGKEIELSEVEQTQYEEAGRHIQETFQNAGKAFSKQFEQINNKIGETILRNTKTQKSFAASSKPNPSQDKTKRASNPVVGAPSMMPIYRPAVIPTPDYAAISDSINQANHDRANREEADRKVAADHLEVTQKMATALIDQAAATEEMARHQRKMNWWILGATLAGVSAAILFGLFGG